MFCQKCGKEIEDNAMFCPNCGGQTNTGNNVQAPTVNYGASYTAVKKPVPLKYIVIPVAILAVAAIVITVLVLTLNNGSSQQGGPGNPLQPGGNFSQPYQTEQLMMTVNGENIPVAVSGFAYDKDGYSAIFIGRKGTKLYGVAASFMTEVDPDCPSSNTTYNSLSGRYVEYVGVMFIYMDSSKRTSISTNTFSSPSDFRSAQVRVGEFNPNEKMGLSLTGKVSNDGLNFDFSASGSLEFYNDPDVLTNKMESIVRSL